MIYHKYTADRLFNGNRMLPAGKVLIMDASGTLIEIVNRSEAGDDVQEFQGILSPGFVNAHCHIELSHMKGKIQPHLGMTDFLLSVIKGRAESPETIKKAIENGEKEMIRNGIVAVGDICNTTDSLELKKNAGIHFHNFIETIGFIESSAGARFADAKNIFDEFKANGLSCSIVPHAPYSVSGPLFRLITSFPGNELLSIHNQESKEETDFFLSKSGGLLRLFKTLDIDISSFVPPGISSLQAVLPYFAAAKRVILVHNVFTSVNDIKAVSNFPNGNREPVFYYCLCPNANIYIHGNLPDMGALCLAGAPVVLGTDSLASNAQLDILSEIKTLRQHFPLLESAQLLQWATANGAEALGIEDRFGSFEKGKRPGVILIDNTENGEISGTSGVRRLL